MPATSAGMTLERWFDFIGTRCSEAIADQWSRGRVRRDRSRVDASLIVSRNTGCHPSYVHVEGWRRARPSKWLSFDNRR
jgi:hypothetical protein